MANRNRSAGIKFELEIIKRLNELNIFPELGSTRELSRFLDSNKIDVTTRNPEKRFDYAIQCKNTAKTVNYSKLLDEIQSEKMKVVFHNLTEKKGSRFMTKGQYAILNLDDFISLIKELEELRNERKISDSRP